MTETLISQLKQAVESQHGGTATFIKSVPVDEHFEGGLVWQGTVHIFALAGCPTAKLAYAWFYELPEGKRRHYAVLQVPPITSPSDAVRAALVAEVKAIR